MQAAGVKHGGIFVTEDSRRVGRAGVRIPKGMAPTDAKKLKEWAEKHPWKMGLPSASAWAAQGYDHLAGVALGVRQYVKFRQIPIWYAESSSERDLAHRLLRALGGKGTVEDVRTLPRLITREPFLDISCTVQGEDCAAMAERGREMGHGKYKYIQVPCPEDIPAPSKALWPGTVQFVWTLPGAATPNRGKPKESLSKTYASVPTQPNSAGGKNGDRSYTDAVRQGAQQKKGQPPRTELPPPPNGTMGSRNTDGHSDCALEARMAALERKMSEMCELMSRRLTEQNPSSRSSSRHPQPARGRSPAAAHDHNRSQPASTSRTSSLHTGTESVRERELRKAADTERALHAEAARNATREKELRVAAERKAFAAQTRVEALERRMVTLEKQLNEQIQKVALAETRDMKPAAAAPAKRAHSQEHPNNKKHRDGS
jgi:hypothetical protein